MTLFHHHVAFKKIDPLANGLADEMQAEKDEAQAISLERDLDSNDLIEFWDHVIEDVKEDPQWFTFSNE